MKHNEFSLVSTSKSLDLLSVSVVFGPGNVLVSVGVALTTTVVRREHRLDCEQEDRDKSKTKVKQRGSVIKTFFSSYYYIFKENVQDYTSTKTYFCICLKR